VAGELETVASELMAAFASKDLDRIFELSGDDAQGVDEISRLGSAAETNSTAICGRHWALSALFEATSSTFTNTSGETSAC
jgi:hypothetical protein